MLIIQNILLKWFDEWQKSTKAQQMQEWSTEQGCRGSGAWGHWDPKLTQSDNGRRQPVCQVSSQSVHPVCRNSRFCPIRGKTQWWVTLGEKRLTTANLD